jgi:hypothetical protein
MTSYEVVSGKFETAVKDEQEATPTVSRVKMRWVISTKTKV